jgi:hypothetical protein
VDDIQITFFRRCGVVEFAPLHDRRNHCRLVLGDKQKAMLSSSPFNTLSIISP